MHSSYPRSVLVLLLLASFSLIGGFLRAADNFASATVLTGAAASSTESSQNATEEAGEPKYSNGGTGTSYRSLWWKWTAPTRGRATVDLTGSTPPLFGGAAFNKYLGVYVAKSAPAAVGALALVHTGNTTIPVVRFPVAAGTTYYLHVCSENASAYGSIQVNVTLDTNSDINQINVQGTAGLGNDAFAQRIVLTGPNASAIAYNYSATSEPGEPAIGDQTVWWSWTAPAHGRLAVSTTGSDGAVWGKYLGVFLGTGVSNLKWAAVTGGSSDYTPSLRLPVTAGQTYQIGLGSQTSGEGGSAVLTLNLDTNTDINQLNIGPPAAAANDLFGNRVTLAGSSTSGIGYGGYATLEALEPANAGYGTMWWTYTAPVAGTVALSTTGSSTGNNKYLTVWTGGSLASLTQVVRSASTSLPAVSFAATAGQTYQLSVGANTASGTPGHVVLSLSGPPGPADTPVAGLVIDNAVRLRWPTVNGASYRVRASNDLSTWTNIGDVIFGDGSVKEVFQPVTRASQYFRVIPLAPQ